MSLKRLSHQVGIGTIASMSIQDITLSHACGAADAGDGALTWKMFAIKRNAHTKKVL